MIGSSSMEIENAIYNWKCIFSTDMDLGNCSKGWRRFFHWVGQISVILLVVWFSQEIGEEDREVHVITPRRQDQQLSIVTWACGRRLVHLVGPWLAFFWTGQSKPGVELCEPGNGLALGHPLILDSFWTA